MKIFKKIMFKAKYNKPKDAIRILKAINICKYNISAAIECYDFAEARYWEEQLNKYRLYKELLEIY